MVSSGPISAAYGILSKSRIMLRSFLFNGLYEYFGKKLVLTIPMPMRAVPVSINVLKNGDLQVVLRPNPLPQAPPIAPRVPCSVPPTPPLS